MAPELTFTWTQRDGQDLLIVADNLCSARLSAPTEDGMVVTARPGGDESAFKTKVVAAKPQIERLFANRARARGKVPARR